MGGIRIAAFETEVQLGNLGQSGYIDARKPRSDIRTHEGADFVVFGETFGVEGHPVTEPGNPITEIQSGAARSWFVGVAALCVACGKYAPQERVQGQWITGASIISGPRQANFEVRGWLKADSFAVNNGLRIQRLPVPANESRGSQDEFVSRILPNKCLHSYGSQQSKDTRECKGRDPIDRKRTRLNSSH